MDDRPLPGPWITEEALAGDASTRGYARLRDANGNSAVIVRYPDEVLWQIARDLEVRSWCARLGLRVPALLEHPPGSSWAVVEDFGPTDAEHRLQSAPPKTHLPLTKRLVEPLAVLSRIAPSRLPPWNRPLDGARLRWELAGFELWFLRHRRNMRPASIISTWLDVLAEDIARHPKRICHRDFHANNLFFLEDETVGVIDFQDILVGPDTYDIVSCLHERAIPDLLDEQQRAEVLGHWAHETSADEGWGIRARQVRLQRALKVLGTFARFEAAGATGYVPWMLALSRDVLPELQALGAPHALTDLLLD